MEQLDGRKKKILKAIIQTYLETGEPVGSRTISKFSDLNLSSATIRNEMSDLEEMGYILQPHTSAGRIPSDKGYRLYVDALMAEKNKDIADIKELMIEKTDKMEKVLKQVVKTLAQDTQYATLISAPTFSSDRLKFIQLSRLNSLQLVVVVVTAANRIRNEIIDLEEQMSDDTIFKLNFLLNNTLNGIPAAEINLGMIAQLREQAGQYGKVVGSVLDAVANVIQVDEDLEIYTSGATNIFKYPELSDSSKASEFISTFEEKQQLVDLVKETMADEESTGIQVYIGDEAPIKTMKDCSVVTATYELGEGIRGTIGIVGPKRMDYENVVDSLKVLRAQLDTMFRKT
ncbi:MAG: heat-inducible transcription repressor HrcA [Lachnospiraceae bacterium]|nr:heat-inducible transcription repressor HrcA [Lachnospiraceae bacterium]